MTDQVILTQTERIVDQKPSGIVVQRIDAPTTVITGMIGPPGISNISQSADVDISALTDGAILIYQTNTSKWTAGVNLTNQIIDGGSY